MKVRIKDVHDSHGLVFSLEMIPETNADAQVKEFFDERVKPIAEHKQAEKIGRSFLYAYEIRIDKSSVLVSFSEQTEHNAVLQNGRKVKAIEIEV